MANILIIATGSIAAVKIPDMVSKLKKRSDSVTCILTRAAEKFVTADSLAYLSENKVHTDIFAAEDEAKMAHISLSRDNDLILVAPASADFIAKMANGFCDDLASTVCLAANKPIYVAPAMNVEMLNKPATQRNLKTIESDGATIIQPKSGKLACGEVGFGKMADIDEIISTISSQKKNPDKSLRSESLKGLKCLVTAGPTRENIDPVRYISNYSSGKQGYAIADSLAKRGAEVTLISGPTSLDTPKNVTLINVESARQMLQKCLESLPCDAAIFTAAVADWRVADEKEQKMKKQKGQAEQSLNMVLNPDILYEVSNLKKDRPKLVIGFAAETENLDDNAKAKLAKKNCDLIVANNVAGKQVFNSDENSVKIFDKEGVIKELNQQSKQMVAEEICNLISQKIN